MVTSDGEVRVQVNKQRRFVFVEDSNEWTQNLSVVLPKGPCREDTSRALDSMAVETLIWLPRLAPLMAFCMFLMAGTRYQAKSSPGFASFPTAMYLNLTLLAKFWTLFWTQVFASD